VEIQRNSYGVSKAGEAVDEFYIANSQGVSFRIITYGATLTSVKTPDARGHIDEITLGFDTLDGYEGQHPYFGATVGRCANRIAGGSFFLDDQEYRLALNNKGLHHIHGGPGGFSRRVWEAFPVKKNDEAGVSLNLHSPHLEEGYPGDLDVKLDVMLNEENELSFTYQAMSDRSTPVSLTNHTYWNLTGECGDTIGGHVLHLNSEAYLEVDEQLIPTGTIIPVDGTAFDFTIPTPLSKGLEETGGYDHCFVLSSENALSIPAAHVFEPLGRRNMTVFTISPGIQLYTGNFLNHTGTRCGGVDAHGAFCLETEEYPDAVHHPEFPSVIVPPSERYFRKTIIQFGIES